MINKLVLLLLAGMLWLSSFTFAQFTDQRTDANPDLAWSGEMQQEGFLEVVQSGINWILWLMALIALIILLWWGFQMVTAAGNEDRYNKWFTILKQAAIWLIMMWVAWFIVSIIFAVIWIATWT